MTLAEKKFVSQNSLLGLMTTITSTPAFMDYEVVHFIKNRFIKAETMDTLEYIAIGIYMGGQKEVLGMWVGENESAKTGDKSTHILKYSLPIDYRSSIKKPPNQG